MSRVSRNLMATALAVVLAPVLLAGCGTGSTATALGDTKAPAQLLRNEIAGRVPADVIESLADSEDESEGCGQDGVMRSWRSTQLMFVAPTESGRLLTVLDGLVASLAAQGWASEPSQPSSKIHEDRLTSSTIDSVIHLRAVEASDDEGNGATLELTVNGACVKTDGEDSDEVMRLEGRN
jgi:hypothetical protein